MHEMSLAEGIRRIVDQATDRPDVTRVTRVRLSLPDPVLERDDD